MKVSALLFTLIAFAGMSTAQPKMTTPSDDPYLWLEEVLGERAIAWVKERNA